MPQELRHVEILAGGRIERRLTQVSPDVVNRLVVGQPKLLRLLDLIRVVVIPCRYLAPVAVGWILCILRLILQVPLIRIHHVRGILRVQSVDVVFDMLNPLREVAPI